MVILPTVHRSYSFLFLDIIFKIHHSEYINQNKQDSSASVEYPINKSPRKLSNNSQKRSGPNIRTSYDISCINQIGLNLLIDSLQNRPKELLDGVRVPLFDGHLFFDFALFIEEFEHRVRASQITDRQSRKGISLTAFDERLQLRPPRQFSSA